MCTHCHGAVVLIVATDPYANEEAFYDWRVNQIKQFRETKQPDPYPHKFHVTQSVPSFIRHWGAEGKLEPGVTSTEGEPVSRAYRSQQSRAPGREA